MPRFTFRAPIRTRGYYRQALAEERGRRFVPMPTDDREVGGFVVSMCAAPGFIAPCCVAQCDFPSDFLCDHELPSGRTCSRALCFHHALEIGEDAHLCPQHAPIPRTA